MIEKSKIEEAIRLLCTEARPRKVILFGSYAGGTADEGSDVDFVVVEDAVDSVQDETVRLLRVLSPLRIPADVIVVSAKDFNDWANTPGNVLHEAARFGKVMYEAA